MDQVQVAIRPGMAERVFQQRHQRLGRQAIGEQRRNMAQEAAGRREVQRHPGAVVGGDPPAVERGRDAAGQHPVGRDQRGGLPGFGGGAQAHRDGQRLGAGVGRLDQRHCLGGLFDVAQPRPFVEPGIGEGRGPQGERDKPVARRCGRGRIGPRDHVAGGDAQPLHHMGEAVLRMVLGALGAGQVGPDAVRLVEVEARQEDRALRQVRHRLHQHERGAARSGRASHQHRPLRRGLGPGGAQRLDGAAVAVGRVVGAAGLQVVLGDADEGERARPVARHVGDVELAQDVGRDAFIGHLVHQRGEAVGEVVDRGAGGQIGLAVEQAGDQLGQLQAAA